MCIRDRYKCGFARNQSAYEKASKNLFAAINEVENLLEKNKGDWIFGQELTYADIYLFPTLIRWELIYSKLFKCTEQELSSFEKIIEWRLKFFKLSNVNRTCFDNEWKKDYYKALFPLNPNQVIPVLPSLKEIMKKGALDPLTKEMLYIAVSMTNSCEYCIRSHTAAARKKGMSDKMLKELIAVVGMANETNRLVESYQVEVDDFLK